MLAVAPRAAAAAGSGQCGQRARAVGRAGHQPAPAEHLPGPLRRVQHAAGPPAQVSAAGGRGVHAGRRSLEEKEIKRGSRRVRKIQREGKVGSQELGRV